MPAERKYVVDRLEGDLVVLIEDESGERVNLDSWELPVVDEGMVLAVELDNAGKPAWSSVTVLLEETERRKEQGKSNLDDLKKRDPGGDITL